jgi:hypothetical protein
VQSPLLQLTLAQFKLFWGKLSEVKPRPGPNVVVKQSTALSTLASEPPIWNLLVGETD